MKLRVIYQSWTCFVYTVCCLVFEIIIFGEIGNGYILTRHCRNRCTDKSNIFCGLLSHRCDELLIRVSCPRTCNTCKCKLITCEDGTCLDVWEPSLCSEFKKTNKCAFTRYWNSIGRCSKTCGDCVPCKLPCTPDCRDYGVSLKCKYFFAAGFCATFPDAQILCPKSCGICRTCPKTYNDLLTLINTTVVAAATTTTQFQAVSTTTISTTNTISSKKSKLDIYDYYENYYT